MDLFDAIADDRPAREELADGAALLRGFALDQADQLIAAIGDITSAAPFRHLMTPGGHTMSVAMTNCGKVGWVSDRRGYRYDAVDPDSSKPWPAMPALFADLALRAAADVGFKNFKPDACLINRYIAGAKMSLHQDRDEDDAIAPIVSVSLGLPATFLFGGFKRSDPTRKYRLTHGDVVVWGGPARMIFHGVNTLAKGDHPATGQCRFNLTFRKVF